MCLEFYAIPGPYRASQTMLQFTELHTHTHTHPELPRLGRWHCGRRHRNNIDEHTHIDRRRCIFYRLKFVSEFQKYRSLIRTVFWARTPWIDGWMGGWMELPTTTTSFAIHWQLAKDNVRISLVAKICEGLFSCTTQENREFRAYLHPGVLSAEWKCMDGVSRSWVGLEWLLVLFF